MVRRASLRLLVLPLAATSLVVSGGRIPAAGALAPTEAVCFPVDGRSGDAALVNLTPVQANARGFGLVLSSDISGELPQGSNVNFAPGTVDPNVAVAAIGADGEVCFHNSDQGSVELVADHLGTIAGSAYTAATSTGAPERTVDTRSGLGGERLGPLDALCFEVAGNPGDAAIINLTPIQATATGFGLLTSSDATGAPAASNVNFGVGTFDPNVAMAPIGADGRVCFTNSDTASVHLVADHLGTISAAAYTPASESGAPARLVDTRNGLGGAALPPGDVRCFAVPGAPGDAAVVNLTPVRPSSSGFGLLLSSDAGALTPNGSNVNYRPGLTDPNVAISEIGADGQVCFRNSDRATVDLLADHLGTVAGELFTPATTIGAPDREVDTRIDFVATAECDGSAALGYDVATSRPMLGLASQSYEIDPGAPTGRTLDTYGESPEFASELACWELVATVEDVDTDTQVIVAVNPQTDDLAIAFRGTESGTDAQIDAKSGREPWSLPDGSVVTEAVHRGFLEAFTSVRPELTALIETYGAAATPGARVYFTGHSLGGALATVATLGLHNAMVGEGYDVDRIVTYTFAAPRSMSRELAGHHASYAPQSYAIATPMDPIPQLPTAIGSNHYSHVKNMVLLHPGAGGVTRIDEGDGRDHRGCLATAPSVVNFATFHPRAFYNALIASQRYIRPNVYITISEVIPAPGTNNIGGTNQLNWDTPAEGPCDEVGLFRTAGTLTSADDPIRTRSALLDTNDVHTTTVGKGLNYWVGYIDQFGGIEAAREYVPSTPTVSLHRVDRTLTADDIQFRWSVADPGSRDLIVLFDRDPNVVGPNGYYRSLVGRVEAEASTNSPETTLVNVGSNPNQWWVAYIMIDDDGVQTILATSRGVRG